MEHNSNVISDFFQFKTIILGKMIRIIYVILFVGLNLMMFGGLFSFMGREGLPEVLVMAYFFGWVIGNIVLRICFELMILRIKMAEHLSSIDERFRNMGEGIGCNTTKNHAGYMNSESTTPEPMNTETVKSEMAKPEPVSAEFSYIRQEEKKNVDKKICPKCGTAFGKNDKFCAKCGYKRLE